MLGVLTLVTVPVAIVLHPDPLFGHELEAGRFSFHSDAELATDIEGTAAAAADRLSAMVRSDPTSRYDVYLCRSSRLYTLLTRIVHRSPRALAFSLSVNETIFISLPRIEQFNSSNQGRLPHSRFEGSVGEAIAHEVAHFDAGRELGFLRHLRLPTWKTEGWAEYQANLGPARDDPRYDLRARIAMLGDDSYWRPFPPMARMLFESHLLVEFLAVERGFGLAELAREATTMEQARRDMVDWARAEDPR